MGVPNYQLTTNVLANSQSTTIFLANYQLSANFFANYQLTVNPMHTLLKCPTKEDIYTSKDFLNGGLSQTLFK